MIRAFAVPFALSALLARAAATSPEACAGAEEADDVGLLQSRTAPSAGMTTNPVSEAIEIVSQKLECAMNSSVTECFQDPVFERLESLLPAVKGYIAALPKEEQEKLGRLLGLVRTLAEAAVPQAEAALLAHRSAAAGAGAHVANSPDGAVSGKKQCGLLRIAQDSVCCTDDLGNGITGSPGSTCCKSAPPAQGVIICAPGDLCNPQNGLCIAFAR